MNRKDFLQLLAAPAAASLLGCHREAQRLPESRLVVSAAPFLSMSPLYLAQELDYFTEAGLEVEIQQILDFSQRMPLLMRRRVDVSFQAFHIGLLSAVAQGANMKIVLGREKVLNDCGSNGAIYGRRSVFPEGLDDLSVLKGKRMAVGSLASVGDFFADILLGSAGMSFDDVEVLHLRQQEAVAALIGGQIDAITATYSEGDLEAMSADVVRGISLADIVPNLQFSFIVFGPSLLEADFDIGVRFLSAYLRGAREFLAGKTPKFYNEFVRSAKLDPRRNGQICRDSFNEDGRIDRKSIELYIDWAVRKGYCSEPIPYEQLVDESFVEEVNRL